MFASYEEMEDAVGEEYQEKITELEQKIDALKLEVSVAEEEAEHYEAEYLELEKLFIWMTDNHPDILTTYEVTQRLEEGK